MLDVLGLSAHDAAVYQSLLAVPGQTINELIRSLSQEPEEISESLDNLKRLELVRPSWTDPTVLRAVAPDVGLRALLADQEAELWQRQQAVARARSVLERLTAEYAERRAVRTKGEAEFFNDVDAAQDRLKELTFGARTEVISFRPGAHLADTSDVWRSVETDALERGVKLRSIFLDSLTNDSATCGFVRWLSEQGAQLRTTPILPIRMTIIDGETAVLPIDPALPTEGVMVVCGRGLLTVLVEYFEQIWESAAPFGEPAAAAQGRDDPERLNAAELAALRMLARGHTDEAVARRLDVSLRTVRRMMARLMTGLGTRSRFEAGVQAAKRGWV